MSKQLCAIPLSHRWVGGTLQEKPQPTCTANKRVRAKKMENRLTVSWLLLDNVYWFRGTRYNKMISSVWLQVCIYKEITLVKVTLSNSSVFVEAVQRILWKSFAEVNQSPSVLVFIAYFEISCVHRWVGINNK